jgi:HEAT repeat protein
LLARFVFGLSPLPRTLAAALRDARDPKPMVRISAVRDLARLAGNGSHSAALGLLGSVLREDSVAAVRAEAALAIADARAEECTDALVLAAEQDSSERVRQLSLVALGEVAPGTHAGARRAIERALESSAPELRFQAVIALHRLIRDAALPAVIACTEDADREVRYVCWRILDEHWSGGEQPPAAVLALARQALSDSSETVRLAAALLLGRLEDRSGADVIAACLNALKRPEHPEDEIAAIELAGSLQLAGARPGLERRAFGLFRGRPEAWYARVALVRLGSERARLAILRGLSAWSRETRNAAVMAAGRAGLRAAAETIARMRGNEQRADPEAVTEALSALASDET